MANFSVSQPLSTNTPMFNQKIEKREGDNNQERACAWTGAPSFRYWSKYCHRWESTLPEAVTSIEPQICSLSINPANNLVLDWRIWTPCTLDVQQFTFTEIYTCSGSKWSFCALPTPQSESIQYTWLLNMRPCEISHQILKARLQQLKYRMMI